MLTELLEELCDTANGIEGGRLSSRDDVTDGRYGRRLDKYHVGDDGRTTYERLKGKKCQHETVVSGEMIHFSVTT